MTMLERLKNFDVDTLTLEHLVEMLASADAISKKFEEVSVEPPEWLIINTRLIRRTIRLKTQESLEKELAETKMRLEASLPAEEKRKKLADKAAALEARLAAGGGAA